jgi:adenylosuccinate lyase
MLQVEAAAAHAMAELGICSRKIAEEIASATKRVRADDVYKEEARIKHDVRAMVNCIRAYLSEHAKRYVHLGLTSYDVVDTANAKRYKDVTEKVVIPALIELEKSLIKLANSECATVQIGRTHGQHAEPITFGFALAEYVERLGERITFIAHAKEQLVGKISGAVGSGAGIMLLDIEPEKFEQRVMRRLGLKAARHSTQIVPAEPLVDLMHGMISTMGVIACLADDMRHLQRTELSEVAEYLSSAQVGSSTMPHKANPINFENIKSFWKAFMPRMTTIYMDQLSEHQRDLTNSASARFIPEIIFATVYVAKKMDSQLRRLKVMRKNMRRNLEASRDFIIAEPLYILLSKYGHKNAHESVRRLARDAREKRKSLVELALKDKEIAKFVAQFTAREREILEHPEKYVGMSERRCKKVCGHWLRELEKLC